MRFLSSQLASTLLWVKMWWAQLEPPAASLVLASPMLFLALNLTIFPGRKREQKALAAVWEHCHIPQDSSQRHVGTDGRSQCCTSMGYGLAVVCELTAKGMCALMFWMKFLPPGDSGAVEFCCSPSAGAGMPVPPPSHSSGSGFWGLIMAYNHSAWEGWREKRGK